MLFIVLVAIIVGDAQIALRRDDYDAFRRTGVQLNARTPIIAGPRWVAAIVTRARSPPPAHYGARPPGKRRCQWGPPRSRRSRPESWLSAPVPVQGPAA